MNDITETANYLHRLMVDTFGTDSHEYKEFCKFYGRWVVLEKKLSEVEE